MLGDLVMLGVSRMRHLIALSAAQGLLLGIVTWAVSSGAEGIVLAGAVAGLKGGVFPWMLWRTMRRLGGKEIVEPFMGLGTSVLAGLVGLGLAFWLNGRLELSVDVPALFMPAALTTILAGLILIVLRHKALTQIVGYLVMENGIFVFGAPLAGHDAVWIELAVLLDLFVAIFVMGIAIHHISRTFDSIDVDRFCSLRD